MVVSFKFDVINLSVKNGEFELGLTFTIVLQTLRFTIASHILLRRSTCQNSLVNPLAYQQILPHALLYLRKMWINVLLYKALEIKTTKYTSHYNIWYTFSYTLFISYLFTYLLSNTFFSGPGSEFGSGF